MTDRVVRIAVVTPIPTPYRDPFWNVVAARNDTDLTVYYCAAAKGDRPWTCDWKREYAWEVLPGRNWLGWKGGDASLYSNPGISKRLKAGNFDAVLIGGYNHPTMLQAICWCIRKLVPYYLMCESHLESPRSNLRRLAKDRLVRWVVGNMAGGFPTGTLAERYLVQHGADPESLCQLPNAPDVEKIQKQAHALRIEREGLRRELGFSEKPTLLFVGRLIPKKGAHLLIEAISRTAEAERPNLVIVGDGPEREMLLIQASQLGVSEQVRFVGFVQPEDIIRWYVASDLFVLPSTETWGVVVSEALAAEVPIVVSDEVGCHSDIVKNKVAGRVVSRNDIQAWSDSILRTLPANSSSNEVKQAWQSVFERLRYENLARDLVTHLEVMHVAEPDGKTVSAG